jgi:xylan 1,4-beta-xylosidase
MSGYKQSHATIGFSGIAVVVTMMLSLLTEACGTLKTRSDSSVSNDSGIENQGGSPIVDGMAGTTASGGAMTSGGITKDGASGGSASGDMGMGGRASGGAQTEENSSGGAPTSPIGQYANPIISGDWSDPGLIRVGNDYYGVRSSFGWQPGLPIVHSRDLVHWEYIGHGFLSHPKLLPGDTRMGIWGLEMGWNPNTQQFLIYAPTRDGEVFVYFADHPEGPYQVKSLGANLGIDPGFFADDDGRLYFLTNKALIHELMPDGLSIKGPIQQIDRSRYQLFEGPDIFKHGGYYYLLFSDGGTLPHEPSTIATLRAKSLLGPWESDPGNPVMFSTDNNARFQSPAHGTLIDTPSGEWFVTYHAHEPAYYTLGRQFLMEPIEWTPSGWWKPVRGKVPSTLAKAPSLPLVPLSLQQSDEFAGPDLGLQWFFTCAPDFSGKAWSLVERSGVLRIHTQKGDLHDLESLPGIFQQRVIDKAFAFETRVTFDALDGREAAGLHMYHDPLMNFWLATTVDKGEKRIAVGKHTLGVRQDLWSVANPYGEKPVHLKIAVSDPETATFFYSLDGGDWRQLGETIYFGASGHHLRDGKRGDPDLGWVGRYKEANLSLEAINGLPENQRQAQRGGNVWTAATFGIFAVQDGASAPKPADFDYLHVSHSGK